MREKHFREPGGSSQDISRSATSSKTVTPLSAVAWIVALILVAGVAYLGWRNLASRTVDEREQPAAQAAGLELTPVSSGISLPAFLPAPPVQAVARLSNLHTIFPTRPGTEARQYTVDTGDSVFEIAAKFNITPETVLWANYDQLKDSPDTISIGMELQIPPVDGVYYQWKEGDTLEQVAAQFKADPEDILNWSGNNIDLVDPQIEPGTMVMIPGGEREFQQWVIPVIPRGRAGVSQSLYGAGTCEGGYDGAFGTGGFVWPAGNHSLSGNDYWSGHLAIDIAAGEGAPVYAADSGVVVFAGGAFGGYGNMVMIDHGNGYQTLYAHLSSVATRCGASVGQGGTIGYAGSTGNSTGAHLHFEVRYLGGFVNPWHVLPAP